MKNRNLHRANTIRRPGILLASLMLIFALSCARSPQKVEILLGNTRTVAGGRADVWFSQVRDEWREDLNWVVSAALVEVRCDQEGEAVLVFDDKRTHRICGVRLRLIEIEESGGTPTAVFEVTWKS